MSILNISQSAIGNGANTALPSYSLQMGLVVGAILVDPSFALAEADLADAATAIAKLQEAVLETGKNKIWPIFRFVEVTDNSEDPTTAKLGYGSEYTVKDGKYHWRLRHIVGGLFLHGHLRNFNKTNFAVLIADDNNHLWGTKTTDGKGMRGLTLEEFYAYPMKIADGTNAAKFEIKLALSKPAELNEDVAFINLNTDIEEAVKGNIDIELVQSAVVAGKATVKLLTKFEKIDLYDTFADEFASGTLWTCSKAGVSVVISGVVKNATAKGWDVSFTGTGVHVIGLTTAKLLAAANIGGAPDNGYEGNTLTVTMPAP